MLHAMLLCAQPGSLWVSVEDTSGEVLPGAVVLLYPGRHMALTDANGLAVIGPVPDGRYRLEVSYLGYEKHSSEIDIPHRGALKVVLQARLMSLQEVKVTASAARLGKPALMLPSEAVGQAFVRKFYAGSLASTLERLPGMNSIRIGMGQSKPMIRGMAFNRVLVVTDGLRHEGQQWGEEHGLETDALGAGRVEVIRGPSSVRYGSDALAGVLNIVSDEGLKHDGHAARLTLHAATVNNTLGGHILWQYKNNRQSAYAALGWWDAADYKVPADSVDVYNFRLPLRARRLRNTAGMEQSFRAGYGFGHGAWQHQTRMSLLRSRQGFFAHAHGIEPRNVDTLLHDRSQRDVQQPLHEVTHLKLTQQSQLQTRSGSLHLTLGYQKNLFEERSPYVNHGFMPPVLPEAMRKYAHTERMFNKDALAVELLWEQTTQSLNWKTGLSAEAIRNHIGGWAFVFPEYRSEKLGVFGMMDYPISPGRLFQAGVRLDAARIRIEEYSDWFAAPDGQYLQRAENLRFSQPSLSWSAGYSRQAGHWAISGNVGKGFRLPTAAELGANGVNYHQFRFEQGNPDLKPEVSYQLDASAEWRSSRIALEISPFLAWSPNYIYLNPSSEHDYLYGNGNQKFEYTQSNVFRGGGEFHLHYAIAEAWMFGLMYEALFAYQLSGPKKGFGLPLSPPQSLLFNLNWSPGRKLPFELAADLRLTSAQNRIVPPEQTTPAWYVVNLRANATIAFGRQNLELSLQLNNLTNNVYLNHLSYYRRINLPEAGRNLIAVIKIPILEKN